MNPTDSSRLTQYKNKGKDTILKNSRVDEVCFASLPYVQCGNVRHSKGQYFVSRFVVGSVIEND